MKGSEGIPSLKVETMNKLVSKFPKAPSLFFSSMFPENTYPSDEVKWEIEYGSAGMTPFVAPGATAPVVGVDGYGEASAKAAYLKEKAFLDETFLNGLRAVGTAELENQERKLARMELKLHNRLLRRKEWMFAQMFLNGGFSYATAAGARFEINYGVPANHRLTLTGNDAWNVDHADSNPILDIMDGKTTLSEDGGGDTVQHAICNSEMIKTLMFKPSFQNLLSKSQFGEGDLFKNPTAVIANLIGVGNVTIYDEKYEVTGWANMNAAVGADEIYVDDPTVFEIGGTMRLHSMSKINLYEDKVIDQIDMTTGRVHFTTALTRAVVGGSTRVSMKKKFIDDNKMCLLNSSVDGVPVAEMLQSPYGIPRRWGMYADKKDVWDPEGVWLRIQFKGLPVMYNPDSTYIITCW